MYYGFGQNISALTPYDEMNILKVEFVHELVRFVYFYSCNLTLTLV